MALTDFLFEGSPPPQTTSYSSTTTGFPDWFSAYSQGLLAKASAVAGEPYQPYTGPRIAGTTPDQNAAYAAVRSMQGAQDPTLQQAQQGVQSGINASGVGAASPMYSAAAGMDPSTAAAPYMANASQTFPSAVNDYMSPYTDLVTNRIAELGARNLSENLLPAVNDTFTSAGQFGSRRHGDFTERAVRDTNESILGQQAQALEQGYTTAGNLFNQDATRQAGLGQLAGQLTSDQANRLTTIGTSLGNLTGTDASRAITGGTALGGLGQLAQSMGYQDASALEGIGVTQQNQTQKNLDTAYGDFLEQRNYPRDNIALLNQALRGVTPPTTSSTTTTAPGNVFQPSILSQLAGAGMTAAALGRAGLFRHGGRVSYGSGGSVDEFDAAAPMIGGKPKEGGGWTTSSGRPIDPDRVVKSLPGYRNGGLTHMRGVA